MWDVQELFRRHHRDLTRFLRRRVASPEAAADLTQEVFLRLLTATPGAAVRDSQAYIFQAARNLAINHNARERLIAFDGDPALLDRLIDEAPDAEQTLLSRQELLIIQNVLLEFPPLHREIFIGSTIEGHTYKAIGKKLGISPNTAYSHMVRMLVRMQLRLDEARR